MPPLLGELRTDALSGVVVPLVIAIVKKQSKEDFLSTTLPALQPIMATAGGETMMHLLRGSEAMVAHMPRATVDECIVPLIMQAFDSGNASTQVRAAAVAAGRATATGWCSLKYPPRSATSADQRAAT